MRRDRANRREPERGTTLPDGQGRSKDLVADQVSRGGWRSALFLEDDVLADARVNLWDLEQALGAKVFDRAGRRLSLNENGRALLPRATLLLEQAGALHG